MLPTKSTLVLAALSLSPLLFTSCGDGPSGSNNLTSPEGLNELVLTLNNSASFEFNADSSQTTAGIETGSFIFSRNNAPDVVLSDISGNTSFFSWPDTFTFSRYTYQVVGDASASLTISGTVTQNTGQPFPLIFAGSTAADPAQFTILFDSAGGVITSVEALFQFQSGGILFTGEDAATILTAQGGAVATGFSPNDSEDVPINDGTFDGDFLSIIDATGDQLDFIFSGVRPLSPTSSRSEEGTATAEVNATGEVLEAEYTISPIGDTDTLTLDLEYTGASGAALPADISYDLTFTSAQGGTYVASDSTTGTFAFFATNDL